MRSLFLTALLALGSCKAIDSMLGVGGPEDSTEATIQQAEQAAGGVANLVLPGYGVLVAGAAGYFLRRYVKARKAEKTSPPA